MNRIVNLAVIGFIALSCDSNAQDSVSNSDVSKPTTFGSPKSWDIVSTEQGATPGKYLLRDGVLEFHPLGDDGILEKRPVKVVDERYFSVPHYFNEPALAAAPKNAAPKNIFSPLMDGRLISMVEMQTQLISTMSSSIQKLQRTVEDLRTANQNETAQLKNELVLTNDRLKALEIKNGAN